MAKIAKKITPKTDIELNRWCIEMAIRWPVHSTGGYGGGVGGIPYPKGEVDADVLGRASKIMAWIKQTH